MRKLLLAAAAPAAMAGSALAQDYPNKPIAFVVPSRPAGRPTR